MNQLDQNLEEMMNFRMSLTKIVAIKNVNEIGNNNSSEDEVDVDVDIDVDYGNLGCEVSKGWILNCLNFWSKINIVERNHCIL